MVMAVIVGEVKNKEREEKGTKRKDLEMNRVKGRECVCACVCVCGSGWCVRRRENGKRKEKKGKKDKRGRKERREQKRKREEEERIARISDPRTWVLFFFFFSLPTCMNRFVRRQSEREKWEGNSKIIA